MAKPANIKNVADAKHLFFGLFGPPGVGKTELLGTYRCEDPNKTVLFVAPPTDHRNAITDTTGIEEWVVDGHNAMNEVLEYLRYEGGKNHEFVVLDSVNGFQDVGLDEIWADVIAEKPHRDKYGLDKPEYGKNMDRMSRWVRHVVGLDAFHFAFVSHAFHYTIPSTGEELLMPWVQGKMMPEKFCGYMNLVAYFERKMMGKGDQKRLTPVLRFHGTPDYYAVDRIKAFPTGRMTDPTMPKIMDAVSTAKAAKTSAKKKSTVKRAGKRRPRTTRRRTA